MSNEITVIEKEKFLEKKLKFTAHLMNLYFLAKEVAEWIDHSNPSKMIKDAELAEHETKKYQISTLTNSYSALFVTEDGLYEVLMQSKMPIAKAFKSKVKEILKDIRKHGFYGTDKFVENALNDPDTLIIVLQKYKEEKEAKIAAQQQVLQLNGKIEADKPKVLFADRVSASHSDILIGDLAKLLKQNGYNIGQNRLFDWLRDNGYLMKSGSSHNMPTQRSMEQRLFNIKERTINNPDGSIRITKTTKVTGKGQVYFVNKFLSQKEQEAA